MMVSAVTGERVVEEGYQSTPSRQFIYQMHMASYKFVSSLCEGKNVLDFGCGSGYGSSYLADHAKSIIGVDVDEEAVKQAKSKYKNTKLNFMAINPDEEVPIASSTFDLVISFQVIEHVFNEKLYVQEARRLLKDGGKFIVITPDRKHRLIGLQNPWNRWHVREYSNATLSTAVGASFQIEKMLFMTSGGKYLENELRRYKINKYALLPFTLPGIPYIVRKKLLSAVHSIADVVSRIVKEEKSVEKLDPISADCIDFVEDDTYSLNLVCVAEKSN